MTSPAFRLSKRAARDLATIIDRIADDSVGGATRVLSEFHSAMGFLARFPLMGHFRADVPDDRYRFWPVHSYQIAYRLDDGVVVVVRVLDGRRKSLDVVGRRRDR